MNDTLLAPPVDLRCPICGFVSVVRLEVGIEKRFPQAGGDVIFFDVLDPNPPRRCLRCGTDLLSWHKVRDQAKYRLHVALGGKPMRNVTAPAEELALDPAKIDRAWVDGLNLGLPFMLENKCLPVADWDSIVVIAHAPPCQGDEEKDRRYDDIVSADLARRLEREVILQATTEEELFKAFRSLYPGLGPTDFWP